MKRELKNYYKPTDLLCAIRCGTKHFNMINLDSHSIVVVVDADEVVVMVDADLDAILGGVLLFVVGGVDEDLVEDLLEARNAGDGLVDYLVIIENPQDNGVFLDGTNVGVGAEQDVLQLRPFLVDFFDHLLAIAGGGVVGGV